MNVLGKEGSLRKAISGDLEEFTVSVLFPNRNLGINTPQSSLNSLGAEIKDIDRPDVGTLAGATQGGQPPNSSYYAARKAKSGGRHANHR